MQIEKHNRFWTFFVTHVTIQMQNCKELDHLDTWQTLLSILLLIPVLYTAGHAILDSSLPQRNKKGPMVQ